MVSFIKYKKFHNIQYDIFLTGIWFMSLKCLSRDPLSIIKLWKAGRTSNEHLWQSCRLPGQMPARWQEGLDSSYLF